MLIPGGSRRFVAVVSIERDLICSGIRQNSLCLESAAGLLVEFTSLLSTGWEPMLQPVRLNSRFESSMGPWPVIQNATRYAPFVVPVLTGTCGFVAASIPPEGGTTNTVSKKSQPRRDKMLVTPHLNLRFKLRLVIALKRFHTHQFT